MKWRDTELTKKDENGNNRREMKNNNTIATKVTAT